jgi:hypothetical protein
LATLIQDSFTFAKVFALLLIIGVGGYLLAFGEPVYRQSFENIWDNSNTNPGAIALGFYSGLFAYQGWNYLNVIDRFRQKKKRIKVIRFNSFIFLSKSVNYYFLVYRKSNLSIPLKLHLGRRASKCETKPANCYSRLVSFRYSYLRPY